MQTQHETKQKEAAEYLLKAIGGDCFSYNLADLEWSAGRIGDEMGEAAFKLLNGQIKGLESIRKDATSLIAHLDQIINTLED